MAELYPAPFADLVRRLYLEPARQQAIFDLPTRNWFKRTTDAPDLRVQFQGKLAGNPLGPAAGPHTQMAQNLVLAWLGGARIMELKTVQIDDALVIPRPCIDMNNVGYNVEFSQELKVPHSLAEYVSGMMMIEMLRRATPAGLEDFAEGFAGPHGQPVYDASVGYNLEGIKSAKVQGFLDGLRDASTEIERLRKLIPAEYAAARALDYPSEIATTLTLSTFHGCPADEIERICEFLIAERDLDVIVKMNPPMLGQERLEHLLNDVLGYTEIRVNPPAYTSGLQYQEALGLSRRLRDFARAHGRRFGAKFSNTLEVINHRSFFTPDNTVMYLSGPPLHVITMSLVEIFREELGPAFPISFSAGIDTGNVADVVACGFCPVTVSSDLLKPGGYGRFAQYLGKIQDAMKACGAPTLADYILDHHGQRVAATEAAAAVAAGDDAATAEQWAGYLNTPIAAQRARENPRYGAVANAKVPKRIDSTLELFDCLTCNKCIPVCPNDANFTIPSPKGSLTYRNVTLMVNGASGPSIAAGEAHVFELEKEWQIANYGDFCNECGNCDTFCPEYGGPYIMKPSFYRTAETFADSAPRDGFFVEVEGHVQRLHARIGGVMQTLEKAPAGAAPGFSFDDGAARVQLDAQGAVTAAQTHATTALPHVVDIGRFHALRVLLEGVLDPSRINQISVAFATEASA